MAKKDVSSTEDSNRLYTKLFKNFRNGAIAAVTGKTLVAPLDRLKILIQTQQHGYAHVGAFKSHPNGITHALRRIYYDGGTVHGLLRGNHVAMVRHSFHGGIGFLIHDTLRPYLTSDTRPKFQKHYVIRNFALGAVCGVGATIVTFPLDTLRVMVATDHGTVRSIRLKHGYRLLPRLYQGVNAGIGGVIPYAGLNFGSRDTIRDWLYKQKYWREKCFETNGVPGFKTSWSLGFSAGIITQFITYPIELMKRRKQNNSEIAYRTIARDFMKNPNQIYRGFSLNIIRHPICNGIVWSVRDCLIRYDLI